MEEIVSDIEERIQHRPLHREAELRCKLNAPQTYYLLRIGMITMLIWLLNVATLMGQLQLSSTHYSVTVGLLSMALYFFAADRKRLQKELDELVEQRGMNDGTVVQSTAG